MIKYYTVNTSLRKMIFVDEFLKIPSQNNKKTIGIIIMQQSCQSI